MNIRKLFTLIIPAFALTLTSCNNGNNEEDKPVNPDPGDIVIKETDNYLIKNGSSDYIIVYNENVKSDSNILKAVSDLQSLFMEATGYFLPSASDAEEFSSNKIISIGRTIQSTYIDGLYSKLESSNLGQHGYVVKTHKDSVYILGNTTFGDMYGMYEFLERQFKFDAFAKDEFYIETNVLDKKLLDFDLTYRPYFDSRTPINFELMGCERTRSNDYSSPFNSVGGGDLCHNVNALIPGSKYYNRHPEWFVKWTGDGHTGQELCLNAHGDAASRQILVNTVAEEMEWRLLADTSTDWISFCQEDTSTVCTCPACTHDDVLYDSTNTAYFAIYIRFINEVAKLIKAWNKEVCPNRNIIIFLWNYGKCSSAPVKLNPDTRKPLADENGNYMPFSDDLILEDNVALYMCGFSSGSLMPVDNMFNQETVEQVKRIKAIMRNPLMYFWCYSSAFPCYFAPFNVIETRKEYYKYMKSCGAIGVYDQGQFDNEFSTDWGALKAYVSAKLQWNIDYDLDTLISDFMKNYYKDASEEMAQMYEFYRSYFSYLVEERGVEGNIVNMATTYLTSSYWPYGIVEQMLSFIDKAYEKILPLKSSNPDLYAKIFRRIKKESLTYRYLEIELYSSYFTFEKLNEMKASLREDSIDCGLTKMAEMNPISNLYAY